MSGVSGLQAGDAGPKDGTLPAEGSVQNQEGQWEAPRRPSERLLNVEVDFTSLKD